MGEYVVYFGLEVGICGDVVCLVFYCVFGYGV